MLSTEFRNKNIYFIGIKGVGMTMLAQFLAQKGNSISGSDITDIFLTDKILRANKIKIYSPFAPQNIPSNSDLIIYSSAYQADNNSELKYIKEHPEDFKQLKILSYAFALATIFNQYTGLAVCGSHGKTTTSAWLAYVLWRAGQQPNALIGSYVPQFKGSILLGSSPRFIAEVDEYQNKLQYFKPRAVVLNNIDYDHPDFFKTKAAYTRAFANFIQKIPLMGFLVIKHSDKSIQKIKKYCLAKIISYDLVTGSYGTGADYLAYDLKQSSSFQIFKISYRGQDLGEFKIRLWGEHNVLNALAVIATAHQWRVSWVLIKKYLLAFKGTDRRGQVLGIYKGAIIVDDYAHHPTEVKASLQAMRQHYGQQNLITLFHPHTFTRTKALFSDFVKSFFASDELIILDIYGSAREQQGGVSSQDLVRAIRKFNKLHKRKQPIRHISTIPQAITYLKSKLKVNDVLLLMGAGDVFRVGEGLLGKK